MLAEGVAPTAAADRHALADALRRIGRVARQPGLVVVISDFRDQDDWLRPLGALRARHSVLAIEVRDPREATLPAVGRLAVVDPETGAAPRGRHLAPGACASASPRSRPSGRAGVARELRRLQVDHVVLSTDSDWLRELGRRLR